jgi:hypothetical protein
LISWVQFHEMYNVPLRLLYGGDNMAISQLIAPMGLLKEGGRKSGYIRLY